MVANLAYSALFIFLYFLWSSRSSDVPRIAVVASAVMAAVVFVS